MSALKYAIIKSRQQYDDYCKVLEKLLEGNDKQEDLRDETELLTLLIEKWDSEHSTINEADPVELLHFLMNENDLKAKDLVGILGVSKGLVSDILNYKKGISKDIIRILSKHFKVSQEAFNRPYRLKSGMNSKMHDVKTLST
jgi:HTH-type transcriptional regulator / antitoxin HigA